MHPCVLHNFDTLRNILLVFDRGEKEAQYAFACKRELSLNSHNDSDNLIMFCKGHIVRSSRSVECYFGRDIYQMK